MLECVKLPWDVCFFRVERSLEKSPHHSQPLPSLVGNQTLRRSTLNPKTHSHSADGGEKGAPLFDSGRSEALLPCRCQAFSGLPFGVDEEPQVEEGSLERASTETDRVGGVKLEPQASGSLPPQPNGIPVGN